MKLYHSKPMKGYRLVTGEATLSDLRKALAEHGMVAVKEDTFEEVLECVEGYYKDYIEDLLEED